MMDPAATAGGSVTDSLIAHDGIDSANLRETPDPFSFANTQMLRDTIEAPTVRSIRKCSFACYICFHQVSIKNRK